MMRSLFSGVSGLKTHQTKMDVIGNNISNVNTVAFKSSKTTFQDLMYQTTAQASGATDAGNKGGVNAKQIGLGVTNGATKVTVTSAGAAQTTGDALDLRLTDTKSTNFFIVSNGTENVFTRAGSFYIDGKGNLAMTTTGYLVMGWRVNEKGEIEKKAVQSLQIMSEDKQVSNPAATVSGTLSGIIDKNDKDTKSTGGYRKVLNFYDDKGYEYSAEFSIRATGTQGKYTIELNSVKSTSDGDLYSQYISDPTKDPSDIFGTTGPVTEKYGLKSDFSYEITADGGVLYYTSGGNKYQATGYWNDGGAALGYTFTKIDPATGTVTSDVLDPALKFEDVFNVNADIAAVATETPKVPQFGTAPYFDPTDFASASDFATEYTYNKTAYTFEFDNDTGLMANANGDDDCKLVFKASALGPALKDITIDLSLLKNFDNGGINSVKLEKGIADETTGTIRGTGKKPGTMTGVQVSNAGIIYGTYSNGDKVILGQIATAQFANASGLEEIGENCYKTTLNSGDFDGVGRDISEDGSAMNGGQLEMSNVDLSSEFTEMIVTQRGFQANSRIITVSDTLLEELINLKR